MFTGLYTVLMEKIFILQAVKIIIDRLYEDGSEIIVNYSDLPYLYHDDTEIPPKDYVWIPSGRKKQ